MHRTFKPNRNTYFGFLAFFLGLQALLLLSSVGYHLDRLSIFWLCVLCIPDYYFLHAYVTQSIKLSATDIEFRVEKQRALIKLEDLTLVWYQDSHSFHGPSYQWLEIELSRPIELYKRYPDELQDRYEKQVPDSMKPCHLVMGVSDFSERDLIVLLTLLAERCPQLKITTPARISIPRPNHH